MSDPSPKELNIQAPLAAFKGDKPEAPRWFEQAVSQSPQRRMVMAQGAHIETLVWGEPGRPGLLLLHGNRAHADWWSFIAPFFAATHQVVALSWSGMGGSDWRERYSIDLLAGEIDTVIGATGLDRAAPPVVVAHSFGGFPALRHAARAGRPVGGLVLADVPIVSPEMRKARRGPATAELRANRVYPDLPSALARFRFAPPQVCKNLFIADHIARGSLKPAPMEDGSGDGWTWRFDPFQWREMRMENPAPDFRSLACPVAAMWGSQSVLYDAEVRAYVRSLSPAGSPHIEIPAARHHLMVDQPLAFVAALRGLLAAWPRR